MTPPLQGIQVLDFSRAVAGPMCTMLLADLGARVIKVEEPGGDEARRWGPPFLNGVSTYFLGLNRNKESAVLDLKLAADRELAQRIAAQSDVVVENFRPGVAERLGIGPQSLCAAHTRLIYASISGFGQSGPDRDRPGYDLILQAISGLMHSSGLNSHQPAKVSIPIADIVAAQFLQQAILAALLRRERTGLGARIETSLLDGLLAAMAPLASSWLMAGLDPAPAGLAHANIVPYQVFQCLDLPLAVGITNERIWARFCAAMGQQSWLADPRFTGNEARNANRNALLSAIGPLFATRGAEHWERLLRDAEVPCGVVQSVGRALEKETVANVAATQSGLRMMGNPVSISGLEYELRDAPALGQHTDAIRSEFSS